MATIVSPNGQGRSDVYRDRHRRRKGRLDKALPEGVRLRIETAYDPTTIAIGASISCAGVCLTVTGLPEAGSNARWFEVEAWEEALRLTTASEWPPGTSINLERALKIGDELGGHIVAGHVDGMAKIVAREDEGEAVRFTLEAPSELAKFIAPRARSRSTARR